MLAGVQVRVFEWVDLRERDPGRRPRGGRGGSSPRIHRLEFRGRLPTDPWYTEAIGSDRWDALLDALHASGAPFAERLSEMRDELVALEGLMEEPRELQTCHRDLWADNVLRTTAGGLCVIDWENCGLADPSQELALVLFEFGLGSPERARDAVRGVPRRRRARPDRPARQLLDAHRAAGAHRRGRLHVGGWTRANPRPNGSARRSGWRSSSPYRSPRNGIDRLLAATTS